MDTALAAAISRLAYLIDTVPALISRMDREDLYHQPAPGKWSRHEILGHLVDSAANNWQRFVRIQFEDNLHLTYDQDNWNQYSYHTKNDITHTIAVWQVINRHLLYIIQNIPEDKMQRISYANSPEPLTLQFLIIDYIAHMEHHLEQISGKNY